MAAFLILAVALSGCAIQREQFKDGTTEFSATYYELNGPATVAAMAQVSETTLNLIEMKKSILASCPDCPPPVKCPPPVECEKCPDPPVKPPPVQPEPEACTDHTFQWKGVSERQALVVILPCQWTGKVARVSVNGQGGNYTGVANGGREHWRWGKKGSAFGTGNVVVTFKDGKTFRKSVTCGDCNRKWSV